MYFVEIVCDMWIRPWVKMSPAHRWKNVGGYQEPNWWLLLTIIRNEKLFRKHETVFNTFVWAVIKS